MKKLVLQAVQITRFMKVSAQLFSALLICWLVFLIASAGVGAASYATLKTGMVQIKGLTLERISYNATTVKTLTFEGSYAALRVYSNDDISQSPADNVYEDDPEIVPAQEPDPAPEPYDEPEMSPHPLPELLTEINITIEQDQQYAEKIDLPDNASVMIGVQPANGIARIDDRGNWDYMPNPGYVGDDEFTIIIEDSDGTEEVKAVTVTISEPGEDTDSEDEGLLPVSGGIALAAIVALFLFVVASVMLRKSYSRQSNKSKV